jgi:nitric oxide synthase oxygenase domain/subunit
MADLSKAIIKADKAKAKAAKEMHKAAAAIMTWFNAERDAGRLHPNSLEGRDQRLTLASDLEELAFHVEDTLEKAHWGTES